MKINNDKRIVLISPLAWEPVPGKENVSMTHNVGMPLGILSVASLLDRDGYDVKVISGAEADFLPRIKNTITQETICVGISSMTGYQIAQGLEIAKAVRSFDPSIPILWGGYHPTILPEQTVRSPFVDIVVRGYGEEALYELVQAIENGTSFDDIAGITYFDGTELKSTPDRKVKDLNDFPPLPYHLVDVDRFLTRELGKRTIGYVSSRGCPNDCKFCADNFVYKRRWKALTTERILDDLAALKNRYGIDSVRFCDSNFFVNEKRVRTICEGMLNRNLNLRWGRVNGTVEVLTRYKESTWELMRDSGCYSLLVGAESGYEGALNRINKHKGARVADILRLSDLTKKYGIRVIYSCMLGVPLEFDDTQKQREEFRKEVAGTLALINKLLANNSGQDRIILFRYTLYPGSDLYDECKNNGWQEPNSLDGWTHHTLWDSKMSWLTDDESEIIDELISLVKKANPSHKVGAARGLIARLRNIIRP